MLERTEAMDAGAVELERAACFDIVNRAISTVSYGAGREEMIAARDAIRARGLESRHLRAYLAALTPSPSVPAHVPVEVEELCNRLEAWPASLCYGDALAVSFVSALMADAASALRTLSAERDAIAQDLRSALHREIEGRKERDRLTADLGEAVKALERKLHAAFMEGRESTFGTDRHRADRAWENSRALASLRARSEASHGG